jgi:hypothetical protein
MLVVSPHAARWCVCEICAKPARPRPHRAAIGGRRQTGLQNRQSGDVWQLRRTSSIERRRTSQVGPIGLTEEHVEERLRGGPDRRELCEVRAEEQVCDTGEDEVDGRHDPNEGHQVFEGVLDRSAHTNTRQ